ATRISIALAMGSCENFCVANLAKTALILILSYFFLFFIYMLYKVGFWHCIIHGFFKLLWLE
ncbi:hypothetical protein, partial [Serratia marcescens]|uniref:hypothetical protein n=1 Tax=Serratia marcescens TaxID=615 RepID=UPI001953ADA2